MAGVIAVCCSLRVVSRPHQLLRPHQLSQRVIMGPNWLKKFNLTEEDLIANNIEPVENCPNGLILEFYRIFVRKRLVTERFGSWLRLLFPTSIPTDVSDECIRLAVKTKLHTRRDALRINRKKRELKDFDNETFVLSDILPTQRLITSCLHDIPRISIQCSFASDDIPPEEEIPQGTQPLHGTKADEKNELEHSDRQERLENRKSTATENELTHKVQKKKKHLHKLRSDIRAAKVHNKKLNHKAAVYKPKNVKRRERRHTYSLSQTTNSNKQLQGKLHECHLKCQNLSSRIKSLEKKVTDEQRLKSYYKRKWETTTHDQSEIKKLQGKIKVLQRDLKYLESQGCDTCSSNKTKHVNLKSGGVFSESLRMCCMFLSALEVASHRVWEVIKVVAHFIFECELLMTQLPGRGAVQNIIDEGQFLMKKYYEERLQECHHFGVKKDGTTRQKRKILGSCFRLDTGEVLPCTFKQVASETGEVIAKGVQEELCEVSQCGQDNQTENSADCVDKGILSKMTYTMSDRAANEKASNRHLDQWRNEIVEGAEPLYHLHCMAHPLLGFHAYVTDDLKKLQREYEETGIIFGRDSVSHYKIFGKQYVATRVPLHVCEILHPMGDERNGVQDKWEGHCKRNNIKSLIPKYEDNRFNALFEASAAVVHHRSELIAFITTLREAGNKNMKVYSVLLDLQDDKVMAVICVLGLTYCQITDPYWTMVTSDKVKYMNLYHYVQKLHGRIIEWQGNPEGLLEDQNSVLADFPTSNQDQLQSCRLAVVDHEMLTKSIKAVTTGVLRCCEKQLADFLGDGKFASEPTTKDLNLTSKSGTTTLEAERQFGSLDASMSRRRHASLHYHSTLLMLKANKKQFFEWLEKKDRKVWNEARQFGKKLRATHQAQEEREKDKIYDNINQAVIKKRALLHKKAAVKRLPTSQPNRRKAQTPPRKTKRQRIEAETPQQQPCLNNGVWVAVAYESGWFPGHILESDGDFVTVDFLHPARGATFKKPEKDDIVSVEPEFIFANVETPISLGRRSRFKIQQCDELAEQYRRFKERCYFVEFFRSVSGGSDGSSIPQKPKRPVSSFIKFSGEIRQENPGMKPTQLTSRASEKWKLLTDEQKAAFKPTSADIQVYNESVENWRASLTEDQLKKLEEDKRKRKTSVTKRRLKKKQRELNMPARPAFNSFSYYVKSMPIDRGDAPITMYVQGLAQQWRKMPMEDKEPFELQARQARDKYNADLQTWEKQMIELGNFDVIRKKSLPTHIDSHTMKPKKPKAKRAAKPKAKKTEMKKTRKSTTKKAASKAKAKKATSPKKKKAEKEDPSWMRDE